MIPISKSSVSEANRDSNRSSRTIIGEGPRGSNLRVRTIKKPPYKDRSPLVTLYPCPICHRNFASSSLKDHKVFCREIKLKKEMSMARSPLIDRWRDTSLEPFIDTICYMPSPPRLYEYDWQSERQLMYQEVGIFDFEDSWDELEQQRGDSVGERITLTSSRKNTELIESATVNVLIEEH